MQNKHDLKERRKAVKKITIAITLVGMFTFGSIQAQAGPYHSSKSDDGKASHDTTKWQELATYDNGTKTSNYGVSWSVDNGTTWGQETNLYVGQEVQFQFNMHKQNVGTHYADFLKSWVDWRYDGTFDADEVIGFGYKELLTNETGNLGSNKPPKVEDYTFLSGTFTLADSHIGDLWIRSRVTCSHSLAASLGRNWEDQWGANDDHWNDFTKSSNYNPISANEYYGGFSATGNLHQGEVEEWQITVNAAPVPEPATMLLFGSGLLGLAGIKRRKK